MKNREIERVGYHNGTSIRTKAFAESHYLDLKTNRCVKIYPNWSQALPTLYRRECRR